ncbi:MAG: (2Fe-2S)-binding protein, partial [Actinomycetota bacterium]|nr:(2Fe-2S)-binding protein [Actinomycetota bacterium]
MHRTLVERAGSLEAVDPVGGWLDKLAGALLPTPSVKDFLSGTWLGHPLHPALTDAALGTWMSATLLDVLGSPELEGAARRLVGIG